MSEYEELEETSYLSGQNASYIEELYDQYLKDPSQVDAEWRGYFIGLANGRTSSGDVSHYDIREQFKKMARQPVYVSNMGAAAHSQQEAVDDLIFAYRRFGYLKADFNPLCDPEGDPRLTLAHYGLSEANFNETFLTRGILDSAEASLKAIYDQLNKVYASSAGFEYAYIENVTETEWLREQIENRLPNQKIDAETQKTILNCLVEADGLEKYLDVKYVGQKRFSIEGGDALIPMLHEFTNKARAAGIHEAVIGMAHRGRLNVLLNVMGKPPAELFAEFDNKKDYGLTSGDVKYHNGFSSDIDTPSGSIHLTLAFNPSHLEFINPVVLGSVRARQIAHGNGNPFDYSMAVLIHGDAAFIGQGVVMETFSLSQTRAYTVGGTIHVVLNNQIGFTTSNPLDARSSRYCTDLAKMIDAPIFHVNGDDPEMAVKIMLLALEYRMHFHKDVVIDLVCYRRHGHQEVDEPTSTAPLMYQKIKQHLTPAKIYTDDLIRQGVITQADADQMLNDYRDKLDKGVEIIHLVRESLSDHYSKNWTKYLTNPWRTPVDTGVSLATLKKLGQALDEIPEGFELQRNVKMIVDARRKMTEGEQPLDWGYAEIMAYATLLNEGHDVRLTGEDSRRGTFFHRQSFIYDMKTGESYMPLLNVAKHKASIEIYDSLLSEMATLGFEYGYSTTEPEALVEWEAQFGDFANSAQVIIDQFISSGWQKWNRVSGLVMLLPHGMEGMGPEHSSARLERYLQLCAQDNMQVCVPTTPAQIFHLLRRQVLRPYRRPLIIMSPKSLLRHKRAVSSLEDLAHGHFQLIIPEQENVDNKKIKRLIACSGKVYYELIERREAEQRDDVAIIRIEQLYPFPYDELENIIADYPNLEELVWCQEEPKNQGAWFTTRHRLVRVLPDHVDLFYVGRRSMAAPAAGYPALHKQQLELFLEQAFAKEIQEKDKVKS